MDWKGSSDRLLQMLRAMLAIAVGLSVTQLNTLLDGFTAWGFTRPESAANIIPWLPGRLPYPLDPGTASALYFGQRVYQFPLGVFGVALGTVLFPLLSRHAAERRFVELRADLATGLRLVLFISVPASAGLAVMARPLTVLLFEHGSFNSQNVEQTAGAIRMYGSAVWAYCGLLIVNRGFYAVGDRRTPLLMSFFGMLINLGLNLILMWPMAGDGLALATATSSAIQFGIAVWLFQNRVGRLNWTRLGRSVVQITAMTMAMAGLCEFVAELFPPARPLTDRVLSVLAPIAASMALYFGVAWLFGLEEARLLFGSLRLSRRIKKGM
jgi:putative peptidoglycan lipid II flippase